MSVQKSQTWSTVLQRDLVRPVGLPDGLGFNNGPEVLLQHVLDERRALGATLDRVETQMAKIWAAAGDHDAGKINRDTLMEHVFEALWVLDMELKYDEAAVLDAV